MLPVGSSSPGSLTGMSICRCSRTRRRGSAFRAEFCALRAAQNLMPILRAGFTSVSVPGGKWFVDVTLREAVNTGMLQGPRIFCAARALTPPGGIFDNRPSADDDLPDDATGVLCRTVEDFVIETRRQCAHGVNMIKIADSRWGDEQTVSREAIAAVVEEAHRRGAKVSIHSRGSGSTRDSALAGVDWIFHADLATAADLDTVAAAGIPIMPAFAQGEIWAEHGTGVAPVMRDRLKRQLDVNVKAMAAAKARGIRLLLGTDSGNAAVMTPGKWHGYEAAFFVQHLGYMFQRHNPRIIQLIRHRRPQNVARIQPAKLLAFAIVVVRPHQRQRLQRTTEATPRLLSRAGHALDLAFGAREQRHQQISLAQRVCSQHDRFRLLQ